MKESTITMTIFKKVELFNMVKCKFPFLPVSVVSLTASLEH